MLERQAQKIAFEFLDALPGVMAFAIPNEGTRRRKGSSMVGVKSGWPDIGIAVPSAKMIWVELKIKGNKQQPNQLEIEQKLKKLGHHYHLVTVEHEYQVAAMLEGILAAHGSDIRENDNG